VSERIDRLQKAVEKAADSKARHVASKQVTERFNGDVIWDGVVETFEIENHPKAKRCYAFPFVRNEKVLVKTVLEIPPVDSPETAVKVAIASEARE
jgi:hypothetical protein